MSSYLVTITVDLNTDQKEKADAYAEYLCERILDMPHRNGQRAGFRPSIQSIDDRDQLRAALRRLEALNNRG